jgi:Hydrolase of X-linked nucleoside diphosphate N terminal
MPTSRPLSSFRNLNNFNDFPTLDFRYHAKLLNQCDLFTLRRNKGGVCPPKANPRRNLPPTTPRTGAEMKPPNKPEMRWLEWSRRLQSLAQNGLTYCKDPYD